MSLMTFAGWVGGLILAVLLLCVIAWIAFRIWLRRLVGGSLRCALNPYLTLPSSSLVKPAAPKPLSPRAARRVANWQALGYEVEAHWRRADAADAQPLVVMRADRLASFALVVDDEELGSWSEIYVLDARACHAAVSNASKAAQWHWMPGEVRRHLPGQSEEELLRCIEQLAQGLKPAQMPTPDSRLAYEQHRRDRLARFYAQALELPLSPADSSAVGESVAMLWGDESAEFDSDLFEQAARGHLVRLCAEQFIRHTRTSAVGWSERRERICVVHERLLPADFDSRVACKPADFFELDDDLADGMAKSPPISAESEIRAAFSKLNEARPHDEQYKRLGRVDWLVNADVYLAPV